MKKNNIKKFLKIFLIIFISIFTINVGFVATQAKNKEIEIETQNKKIKTSNIAKTGVAISVNLGLRLGDKDKITSITMQRIFSVKETEKNKNLIKKEIIIKNMLSTKEYYSILKSDFRKVIKDSKYKDKTLKSIINQLKLRQSLGIKQIENLQKQREVYIKEMEQIEKNIEGLKVDINSNFKTTNTDDIEENINSYLLQKNRYYYFRTLIVFEDKFIKYYEVLNNYNKKLLDNFTLNKDIIVKGSYLVIPDNGNTILEEYGLLYTQGEYEEILEKEKSK